MAYEEVHKAILNIAKKNHSCVPGLKDAVKAENFQQLITIVRKYWQEVLNMHFEETFWFLETFYEDNKEKFQEQGLFYNVDSDWGTVLIRDVKGVSVGGTSESFVYGNSEVYADGHAKVYAKDNSRVVLHGRASGIFDDKSVGYLHDRSTGNARGNNTLYAYDSCTIMAGGTSIVYGHGWQSITAIGDAEVFANSPRKIYMNGSKQLKPFTNE